ncbi:MAG: hypothetical protein RL277_2664 [Planctomycetota bacterium]|jgi:hypothetical protein
MKRHSYDTTSVQRLLPLLRSISMELRERSDAIENLDQRVLELGGRNAKRRKKSDALLDVEADLANHRRELRHTQGELTKLGCVQDQDHPLRILIPGSDGEIEHGFTWDGVADTLKPNELAAA